MTIEKTLEFTDEINSNREALDFLEGQTPEGNTIMILSYIHGMKKSKDKQTDLLNHDQLSKRVEENTRERTEVLDNELRLLKKDFEEGKIKKEFLEKRNNLLNNEIETSKKEGREEQKKTDKDIIDLLKKDKNNLQKQISSFKESLQKNTEAVQTLTNVNNNSQKKGKVGEDLTKERIIPNGWEYDNKSQESHQGDGHLWNPQTRYKLLIDYKNHTQKVPKGETLKLIKDVKDNHMKAGVMVSLTSGISHHTKSMERNSIDLEMIENIPYLFISNTNNLSGDILKSLMITLDRFISEISGDKANQVELKILLLHQSMNMLNTTLDRMKNLRKTILTMEKSFRIAVNNLRNDIDSGENEIKKIISKQNDANNVNDNDNINNEITDEIPVSSQTSEVQEVINELIDEVPELSASTKDSLNKETRAQLLEICKGKGIKGVSKSNKDVIIEEILNNQ